MRIVMRTAYIFAFGYWEGAVVEQSALLRHWMKLTGLTRQQAANKLGIKLRRFHCWLLPVDSKERRGADSMILAQVEAFVAEAGKIARDAEEGILFEGIEASIPYTCERTGVVFPAIFRVYNPTHRFIDEARGVVVPDGDFDLEYSFSPRPSQGGHWEEISHLNAELDTAWLSVVHLDSYAETKGFWIGNLNADLGDICICRFNGTFFGLKREIGREENNGLIAFTTRFLDNNLTLGWSTDFHTVVIGQDGSIEGAERLYQS